jgi:hypothetical protein
VITPHESGIIGPRILYMRLLAKTNCQPKNPVAPTKQSLSSIVGPNPPSFAPLWVHSSATSNVQSVQYPQSGGWFPIPFKVRTRSPLCYFFHRLFDLPLSLQNAGPSQRPMHQVVKAPPLLLISVHAPLLSQRTTSVTICRLSTNCTRTAQTLSTVCQIPMDGHSTLCLSSCAVLY